MPLPIPVDLHNRVTEIISPTANCAAGRAQHPGPTAHAVEIVTLVTSANMHQDTHTANRDVREFPGSDYFENVLKNFHITSNWGSWVRAIRPLRVAAHAASGFDLLDIYGRSTCDFDLRHLSQLRSWAIRRRLTGLSLLKTL
jgi:hypothetical protein